MTTDTSKVTIHMVSSLDFFIAKKDGTVSWLESSDSYANGAPDPEPIPAANIRGTAQWIVPFVGLLRIWAAQGQWALLIVTIAATATALWLSRFAFGARNDPWRRETPSEVEAPS